MNAKLWIMMLMTTITLGCSAEPDGKEAVVIMWDDDAADTASEADMGADEDPVEDPDMGSEDVGEEEPDIGEMEPDLPEVIEPTGTTCAAKDAPVQLINTCTFEWDSCDDGKNYAFECNIQNVAGNVFSLCNCFENGVMDEADKIVDICGAADWAEVEAIVNEQCGWDLQ